MTYCLAFEAKSIQAYILDSGKLRDMVGASRLVERLVGEPLDRVLSALEMNEGDIRFSRRAGGAFMAFLDDRDKARALRDAWSLIVPRYAPGLEFVMALVAADDDREAARKALDAMAASRIPTPRLPSAAPLARIAPRTGLPATANDPTPDGREWADAATLRKRAFKDARSLEQRFLRGNAGRFPLNLEEEFPFNGDNRYVGIVHADGNGLGRMLMALRETARKSPDGFVELYRGFSERLVAATEAAAQRATTSAILSHADGKGFLPIRPLVLGGDDLTCIVRGDLALSFVCAFLEAFEKETRNLCDWLSGVADWHEEHLTACAGIAYVKVNQPFALGYGLAEALCGKAKDLSGRVCSAVCFHRVSTSFIPDADWVVTREMTTRQGKRELASTLGAYALHAGNDLPTLDDLKDLAWLMAADGDRATGSAMRRLLGLATAAPQEAERAYRRWREMLADDKTGDEKLLRTFDSTLSKLLGESPAEALPARHAGDERHETPLGDVLALHAVDDIGCREAGRKEGDERDAA